MSDSHEDHGEFRPLSDEEQTLVVSSMFTSTALLCKQASELCGEDDCTIDHTGDNDFEVTVPFLEVEMYYEGGGKIHGFIPVQLIPGLIEAASKTLGRMFPGWGSLSGETMQMPDSIEDWPGIDNQGETS
jgi:hypothetical protein